MNFFSQMFQSSPQVTPEDIQRGTLIDVRSESEFAQQRHPKSINIPLDQIEANLAKIKTMKAPIYLCCASGGRSGRVEAWLRQQGVEAINLGGWHDVPKC